MALRRLPYGANFLDIEEMDELQEALEEKVLFRYTTERQSSGDRFEAMVREKFGTRHALATLNCTQGLRLALLATRPKVGDKVYIPAMTFIATAGAVLSCGLIPVLTDVDENFSLDPAKLPADAQRVIVCHMDGHAGAVPEKPAFVIEDTAQSMGARFDDGSYAGTRGAVGVYSFQHAKILTSGQGGLLVTDRDELYQAFRTYHDHGATRRHGEYPTWPADSFYGENMIAGEAQTSIQIQQFRHLDRITAGLERGYGIYREEIESSNLFTVIPRHGGDQKLSLRLRFTDQPYRDKAIEELKKAGLPFWTYDRYFLPDHAVMRDKKSVYADGFPWNLADDPGALWDAAAFEGTRRAIASTLCLPVSPEQDAGEQRAEASLFRQALGRMDG